MQFNGSYTFTRFEGDIQAVYAKMGLPWELRMLAKQLNYGMEVSGERVVHKDNYMRITSLVNLNHKYYVLGSNDYTVGEGRNTGFGYSICGNWVRNGTELLVRIEEAANSPFAGVVAFPSIRRYFSEDGVSQIVEATVDGLSIPMTMTPRSKHRGDTLPVPVIPPELLPDGSVVDGDVPVDSSNIQLTKEQALSFAGMMTMGLLPPFIPMQLVDFAEAEN